MTKHKPNFALVYYLIFFLMTLSYYDTCELFYIRLISVANLIGVIVLFWRYRNSPSMGPFFLFLSFVFYSILIGRYIYPEDYPINIIIDYNYDYKAQLIMLLFCVVFSFYDAKCFSFSEVKIRSLNFSGIVPISFAIFAILLMYFNSTIVQDGRGGYDPIYEYSIVFFIFSLLIALQFDTKILLIAVLFMLIGVGYDFNLGHRVTGMQIILVIYVLLLSRFYTYRKLIFVLILAILASNAVEVYRTDFTNDFVAIVKNSINNSVADLFVSNTAIYAYVASLTFISVREMLTAQELFHYFIDFVIGIFVSGQYGQTLYSISRAYFQHANGGLLPIYLYFYFGYAAPLIIANVVALYMRIPHKSQRPIPLLIFVYVFATMPRWILYSPSQLFRGVLLLWICANFLFISRYLFISGIRTVGSIKPYDI